VEPQAQRGVLRDPGNKAPISHICRVGASRAGVQVTRDDITQCLHHVILKRGAKRKRVFLP
jgi:hypothetical protein